MTQLCRRRVVAGWVSLCVGGGAVFSSCTALVELPGGRVDVSDGGVFIDFLGASVSVTEAQVRVDFPGLKVDVHDGRHHGF